MTMLDTSRVAFERAFQALGGQSPEPAAFERLCAAYSEPHRHYHTLEHVLSCLAWLDWTWSLAARPHEVLLAIWYHDAVYEPLASDNEARSAARARLDLEAAGVTQEAIARVEALVMATREHALGGGDAALLVDIDLAILGSQPADFERFEAQVRREYSSISSELYALGRASVLTQLAAREPLYATAFLQSELGPRARLNLTRAVTAWNMRAAANVPPA